jgi:hypothetical protein
MFDKTMEFLACVITIILIIFLGMLVLKFYKSEFPLAIEDTIIQSDYVKKHE